MSPENEFELEHALRDVFAHQAASADVRAEAASDAPLAPLTDVSNDDNVIHFSRRRIGAAAAGLVAVAAAIALFAAAVAPGSSPEQDRRHVSVLAALGATVASGSFRVAFDISESKGTPPTTTAPCPVGHDDQGEPIFMPPGRSAPVQTLPTGPKPTTHLCVISQIPDGPAISGTAVVEVNPLAVSSTARLGSNAGTVSLLENADSVWLTDDSGNGPKAQRLDLSAFVEYAQQILGMREAPSVALSLASPTGYLTLSEEAAQNASPAGTGEVDGVPVTYYEVTFDAATMAKAPHTSTEQAKTLAIALKSLKAEGYTGTTMRIGIGDDDYIHSLRSTTSFADGGRVVMNTTYSHFGCAGNVKLPNQPAVANPAHCSGATPTTLSPTTTRPTTTTLG